VVRRRHLRIHNRHRVSGFHPRTDAWAAVGKGIIQAFKVDSFSLTCRQFALYVFMAPVILSIDPHFVGAHVTASQTELGLAMQSAMVAGFITAYPANWGFIKAGIKENT
jgi:Domain of unknown function (DUF4396)